MKKILAVLCCTLLVGTLTGCGSKETTLDNGTKLKTKGNCNAVECIKQISIDNTVEEINNIIGVDGKLTDEEHNTYYWELSDDTGIEVTYNSSKKGTIEVDIERELVANKKVDFSRYSELKPKIKEGVLYTDFITYIGNVEGILVEKSSVSNKYLWVSENGSYLNASFSNSSGKCIFANGRVK